MRTNLFLIVAAAIAFSSCDETTINIDTEFSKTIVVESKVPTELKSTGAVVALDTAVYFVSDTIDLTTNVDLDEYMDNIQDIVIDSILCVFSGIPSGDTIYSFNIGIENTDLSRTLTNITENNTEYPIPVVELILEAIGSELYNEEKLIFKLEGTTSDPMTFSVGIKMGSKVKARILESTTDL